jgi:hypothetical protein
MSTVQSDLTAFGSLFKQEGTAQRERYLRTLDPGQLAIDDRPLRDLILYAQQYARNLTFIPTEPGPDGPTRSWGDFYAADLVLLLANIAAGNVRDIKDRYDELSARFGQEKSAGHLGSLVEFTLWRYVKLQDWYAAATPGSALRNDLQLYIQSYLSRRLGELRQIIVQVGRYTGDEGLLQDFVRAFDGQEVWGDLRTADRSFAQRVMAGQDDEEKMTSAAGRLDEVFDAVFHVTEIIAAGCNGYLTQAIDGRQDHPPHIALLIAFFKLYGYLQDEINRIPGRHLRYYYEQVLRIGPRAATPDQVFLVFELVKGFEAVALPKGRAFSAGKDRLNRELHYRLDAETVLSRAQVSVLQSVFIETNAHHQITRYYAGTLEKPAGPAGSRVYPPPFGRTGAEATVGFAIASTQFYLARGLRNVTIRFRMEEAVRVEAVDPRLFKLRLTGEKGWLDSDRAEDNLLVGALTRADDRTFQLTFSVPIAQESAVVAFDPARHEGPFTARAPVMQLLLKYPPTSPDATGATAREHLAWQAQLHALQHGRVVETTIEVEVGDVEADVSFDGVRDLTLQNHDAVLDGAKPFHPFTASPKVGSSFYVSCKDLQYKHIQRLSLNIEWMLPPNFATYYQEYFPPYNANEFRATLSLLNGKRWQRISPEKNVPDVALIQALSEEPALRSIKFNPADAQMTDEGEDPESAVSRFDVAKPDRTLKLKLSYPDFGHGVYPQLMSAAALKLAASKDGVAHYGKIIRKQLRDFSISIELPDRLDQRDGPLKAVVYKVLESGEDDAQAREMMIRGLNYVIRAHNRSNPVAGTGRPGRGDAYGGGGTTLVNDDNFVERAFSLLRRLKMLKPGFHFDRDEDDVSDVARNVIDRLDDDGLVMPQEKEMVALIVDETNNAITRTVVKVADQLIAARKDGVSGGTVRKTLEEAFAGANEVINQVIAEKIASVLLASRFPPPPYTPLVNAISLGYRSAKVCRRGEDQFFQVTPFGVLETDPFPGTPGAGTADAPPPVRTQQLFPRTLVGDEGVDGEGLPAAPGARALLLIGLRELVAGQSLSLLFHLEEGSQQSDATPPPVQWWYLADNRWKKLSAEALVADSTYGLQTTGIVQLAVPPDAGNRHTLFVGGDLHWLCAGIDTPSRAFPALVEVRANAATATFHPQDNDEAHLDLPLPAGKVTRPVEAEPAVKKTEQPVASVGGRGKERENEYYTRVSERLRHKGRAVANWDYERLVLEHFPTVYKVKCLNNYYNGFAAAGHVTVVPISDQRNQHDAGGTLLLPKCSHRVLRGIEKMLSERCSPFVQIHAVNPELNFVRIHGRVKFRREASNGYYLGKLNEELVQFLSPWAFSGEAPLSFSSKIYASSVIDFIDERPYVEYVTGLAMYQYTEDEDGATHYRKTAGGSTSLLETQFTTGHALLVSAPRHQLELVPGPAPF